MTDIKEQFCGTCKWRIREDVDSDWACMNPNSDCFIFFTEYDDWCPDWEART